MTRDGTAQTVNFSEKINYSSGKKVKIFVWDSLNKMQSLMDAYSYVIN